MNALTCEKMQKNMCHNIRFHLGEYPHVSAKMRLGECADGSQIGRTYALMSVPLLCSGFIAVEGAKWSSPRSCHVSTNF